MEQGTLETRDGWTEVQTIGNGGFGTVVLWKDEDGNQLALKHCRLGTEMTPKHRQRWQMEVDIMKRLSHDNVIRCIDVPETLEAGKGELPRMAMEYCSGGDLRKLLNKVENCCGLREYQIRDIVKDVANGIEYLHSKRIIHRDLKPENIVIQEIDEQMVYKIIDLGYAKELDQGSVCTSFVGTLQYLAPELIATQKYTLTVDYWSFGTMAFECITGRRPFFHSLPPVQWHGLVHQKTDVDIFAELASGKPEFSKEIPDPCSLCRTTKMYFNSWLRLMLMLNPRMRGGGLGDNKRPKCFSMLDNILSRKIIQVLCVYSGKMLSYPLKEDTTIQELQGVLEKEVQIPVAEQELLLASGIPPDPKKPATQCWMKHGDDEWVVYLFKKNDTNYSSAHWSARPLPPSVQYMKQDPSAVMAYKEKKRHWAIAINCCIEQARDYHRVFQSQRAASLSLLRFNNDMNKLKEKLKTDVHKLLSTVSFFKSILDMDLEKYKDQASTGVYSERMCNSWQRMREDADKMSVLLEEVRKLDAEGAKIQARIAELQKSPYAKARKMDALDEIVESAKGLYEDLRQKSKEQTHVYEDNKRMVTLVNRCTTHRHKLLTELYQHLGEIGKTKKEITNLMPKLDQYLVKVTQSLEKIETFQKQRQMDMWSLVKVALTKQPPENGSMMSLSRSSSKGSSGGAALMSSMFEKSCEESLQIIDRNAGVRSRLQDVLSSMDKEGSEPQSLSESFDWSFLNET